MRRRSFATSFVFACCAVALSSAVSAVPPPLAREAWADAVDDQVAAFRELLKGGDEAQVTAAIPGLARRKDPRAGDALLQVLRTPGMDKAAKEAMQALSARRDAGYIAWVRSKLVDRKQVEERPEQFTAMLASLPAAGEALKPCLKPLADLVSDILLKRPEVAASAIRAYSSAVAEKAVVEQLIAWLEKTEEERGGGGGARGGLTVPPPTYNGGGGGAAAANPMAAKEECLTSLARLTGGDATSGASWRAWWSSHKAAFKSGPAPQPEPEWQHLAAFEDTACSFVLRKPAAAGWEFSRCPATSGRVRLEFQGAKVTAARLDISTAAKGAAANAAGFAQRLEAQWRKSEFGDFFRDGEPKVAAQTIGGREFAVVSARGTASGGWKDWDGGERRTYVTSAGASGYLVLEAIVRTGTDAAVRDALVAAIEGLTFTDAE